MAEKIRVSHIGELSQVNAAIRAKGFPCTVTITGASRSLPQNALFHKWCEEIARFFVSMGKTTFATGAPMDRDNVKRNLKQTFLGEQLVQDINLKTGEITDRYELKHTSELDKGEMNAFMTCIDAWATEHGIYLPHPEDSEYMRMKIEFGGGRSMKGKKAPSAEQKRYHDLLAQRIGCIACQKDGRFNPSVSIHHVDGRTKPDAHWMVLGLCAGHHQDGYGAPGLIAVHPYKARFELAYGKQETLIRDCALQLLDMGLTLPARVMELIGLEQAA